MLLNVDLRGTRGHLRSCNDILSSDAEELEQRYETECFWARYEELVTLNDNARRWMSEAFPQLPNLGSVTFDQRFEYIWGAIVFRPPHVLRSQLKRGMACSPAQFGGLVRALDASGVSLNRFDSSGICWDSFEDSSKPLGRIVQSVHHLSLQFQDLHHGSREHRDMLGEVVSNAPDLQTLEISFSIPSDGIDLSLELAEVLPRHTHWSSLTRLKLEAVSTSKSALMHLLSSHATTLRSLQLGYIAFDAREKTDGRYEDSWTEMVHFLQRELSLTEVSLHGSSYPSRVGSQTAAAGERWPRLEDTLKFKVERYIIEGGVCPLDNLRAGFDYETHWLSIQDHTWHRLGPSV